MTRRAILASLLLACGCQTVEVERLEPRLDLRAPLRVAALPFEDRAAGDVGLAVPLGAMMDLVPFMSDDDLGRAKAPAICRDKLTANLRRTPLEVLPPLVVDAQLEAAGLPLPPLCSGDRGGSARRVGAALGVDVVLFGEVAEWDRHYALAASWVAISLRLEARDGRSGELLFKGEVSDVETAGLHEGMIVTEPVEFLVVAIGETLRGLRNTLFAELSDELCRALVEALRGPPDPSAPPPRIRLAACSLAGEELLVVLLGTAGQRATLRLKGGPPVALVESSPGTYHRVLWAPGAAAAEPLELQLTDRSLRSASLRLCPDLVPPPAQPR
ncbi:MAG: hypothetical protein AB7N76_27270 [Planctomycetota bacterium]